MNMAQKRKSDFIDPDYTSFTHNIKDIKKPKFKEDENINIEKIVVIIKREFQRELSEKEEEVLKIENSIAEAKKMLQRVRYAVVKSYYTKLNNQLSEGEIKAVEEYEKMSFPNGIIDEKRQMPIHPSLKKLIGKKPIDYNEILCARPMRKAAQTAISNINEKCIKQKVSKSNITTSVVMPNKTSEDKIPRYISPIKQNVEIPKLNSSRGKNHSKHLIVVGNTSIYIGDEKSKDAVTHKWLVFLRTKTSVPIEDIVQKVRFYLHPSYRPNDVIDVTSPPFQLTRRGWGEFPIRLMVHFYKHVQQKPVQIIHSIVLDKECTRHQIMGAETILEMWINNSLLHTVNSNLLTQKDESKSNNFCHQKHEDDYLKHPKVMVRKELEFNNVVSEDIIESKILNEHKIESLHIIQSQNGTFIDDHDYFVKPVPLELQMKEESEIKPIKLYQNEILVEFQKLNPSSTSEAVKFLLKKLPLINPRVTDSTFKSNFPFAMESKMKWKQMSTIKQKTKQWFRAKLIRQMLEQHSSLKNDIWSTREIAAFARCHGYDENPVTTVCNVYNPHQNLRNIVQHEINKEKYPHRSMTASLELKKWLNSHQRLLIPTNIIEDDIEIVDSFEDSYVTKTTNKTEMKSNVMSLNKNILLESKFVTAVCAEIDIQLKPEELIPGILHKTSNLMLITATKCFLEDLLRRALADRYSSSRETSNLLVIPKNIQNALQTRQEFDFLTNFNLAGLHKKF
ncbi:unnamed protein product [Diamesa serratosioi]